MGKRLLALGLAVALAAGLTGCNSENKQAAAVKKESMATAAEVVDYYTQALSYDTIANRTTEVSRVVYETAEVSQGNKEDLVKAAQAIQAELFSEDWGQKFHVSKYQHQYIKYLLDDKVATYSSTGDVVSALGYFFVDLNYKLSPQAACGFTADSKYVGINGAYTDNRQGKIDVDQVFMTQANLKVLQYCQDNNVSLGTESIPDGGQSTIRKSYYDIGLYNQVAGMSKTQTAFMPPIKMVIKPSAPSGQISGYGMYPQGNFALKEFGYSRANMGGTMTIRYVFKQNLVTPTNLDFINVYCTEYTLDNRLADLGTLIEREGDAENQDSAPEDLANSDETTPPSDSGTPTESDAPDVSGAPSDDAGFATPEPSTQPNVQDKNIQDIEELKHKQAMTTILVPEFVQSEIEKLIERSDRAICNGDLAALLSGDIYEDVGVGYLYGFYKNSCYGKRHMSKVCDYLAREGNKYLVEVESTIQESPIKTNQTGTYVQKSYVVVEQQGLEFKIVDFVVYDYLMTGEPQIDVDSNIMKQLAALNLRGTVPDDAKTAIKGLLGNLYASSTARNLDGMYACFDSDTTILPSKQYEYLNSQLRSWLTKMGTNVAATYQGQVSEWLGGSSDQAELTAEEIIVYEGKDIAQYMKTYYLVSNYNGNWVIDDMQILDSEDINGAEAETIVTQMEAVTPGSTEDYQSTMKDLGRLTLVAVAPPEKVDNIGKGDLPNNGGTPVDGTPTDPNAGETTPEGEGAGTPVAPTTPTTPTGGGTGDANAKTNTGGEYVWSDKEQDWVWQAG